MHNALFNISHGTDVLGAQTIFIFAPFLTQRNVPLCWQLSQKGEKRPVIIVSPHHKKWMKFSENYFVSSSFFISYSCAESFDVLFLPEIKEEATNQKVFVQYEGTSLALPWVVPAADKIKRVPQRK